MSLHPHSVGQNLKKMPQLSPIASCYTVITVARRPFSFQKDKLVFSPLPVSFQSPVSSVSITLSVRKSLLDLTYLELWPSVMNQAEGETKGTTSTKLLYFSVGALQLQDKNKSIWKVYSFSCAVLPGGCPCKNGRHLRNHSGFV